MTSLREFRSFFLRLIVLSVAGNYSCLPSYTTPDTVVIHITTGFSMIHILKMFSQNHPAEEPAGLQLHHSNSAPSSFNSQQFSCSLILLTWIASSIKWTNIPGQDKSERQQRLEESEFSFCAFLSSICLASQSEWHTGARKEERIEAENKHSPDYLPIHWSIDLSRSWKEHVLQIIFCNKAKTLTMSNSPTESDIENWVQVTGIIMFCESVMQEPRIIKKQYKLAHRQNHPRTMSYKILLPARVQRILLLGVVCSDLSRIRNLTWNHVCINVKSTNGEPPWPVVGKLLFVLH